MQTNKFNRSDFYIKAVADGVEEFDLVTNSINDFKFSREMTYYKVTSEDIGRPDLISVKAYSDKSKMNLWWIVMWINQIHNVWTDLQIGMVLNIPHPLDCNDLLAANSSR